MLFILQLYCQLSPEGSSISIAVIGIMLSIISDTMSDYLEEVQNEHEMPSGYEGLNECLAISSYSAYLDGIEANLTPNFEAIDANAATLPRRMLGVEPDAKVTCLGVTFRFKTPEETNEATERIDNGMNTNPTYAINWSDRPGHDKNGVQRVFHVRAAVPVLSVNPSEDIYGRDCLLFELDPTLQQWGKGGLSPELLQLMEARGFRRNLEGARKVSEKGNPNLTDRTVLIAIPVDEVQFFVQFRPEDYEKINESSLRIANTGRYSLYSTRYEIPNVQGVG